MQDELARMKQEILSLRRARRGTHKRPHKLLLLLAVLDLADDGLLDNNRIYLDQRLISRFRYHFERFRSADDMCQPAPPFFHLRSSPFWLHEVSPNRAASYKLCRTSGGGLGRILKNIEYAYLATYAHAAVMNPTARVELRRFIEQLLESDDSGQGVDRR